MTESLKTESGNEGIVANRFDIYDINPWSFRQLSLCLHLHPHFMGNAGINSSRNEGAGGGQEHSNLKRYLPPWRFVVAALASVFGISFVWWNLRRERRKFISIIILVIGFFFWGYAVSGLLLWGFQF